MTAALTGGGPTAGPEAQLPRGPRAPSLPLWATRKAATVAVAVVAAVAFALWAKARVHGLSEDTQATNPIIRWEFVFKRERTRDEIWTRLRQHVELTVVPVAIGLAISSALAVIGLRFRWLLTPIFTLAGFLYTIPSLALFGVLVVYNTNWTAAVIALTSYTILIITRNIVEGIDGVPASALDAADGLGMSRTQRFAKVELPLALPVILTGIRVATVTTVGLVGISAVIQLGGLARFVFDGFKREYTTQVVLGSALMVLLAVALDLALRLVERAATPWSRRRAPR